MKIIGFKIDKIIGERFKEPEGNIDLQSNFHLGDVVKQGATAVDAEDKVFSFDFTYTLDYIEHAKIQFTGQIYMSVDKKISKDLEKDKKVISDEVKTKLLNFILFKTHVEALHLEERLGLPFHVASPKATVTSKED